MTDPTPREVLIGICEFVNQTGRTRIAAEFGLDWAGTLTLGAVDDGKVACDGRRLSLPAASAPGPSGRGRGTPAATLSLLSIVVLSEMSLPV